MDSLRQNPFFAAWVMTCGLGLMAQLVWLHHLRGAVGRENAALARRRGEWEGLARDAVSWTPTAPGLKAPAGRGEDNPTGDQAGKQPVGAAPGRSLDIVMATSALLVELRQLAAEHRVVVRPDEGFGFSTYLAEAPERSTLPEVWAQLRAVRQVVTAVMSAGPDEHLGVARERPVALRASRHLAREPSAGNPRDFFTPDPRVVVRPPADCRAVMLRIVFLARTDGLRRVLNALAEDRAPMIVRMVEVEPAPSPSPGSAGSDRRIAARDASRFSLIVECVVQSTPENSLPP